MRSLGENAVERFEEMRTDVPVIQQRIQNDQFELSVVCRSSTRQAVLFDLFKKAKPPFPVKLYFIDPRAESLQLAPPIYE